MRFPAGRLLLLLVLSIAGTTTAAAGSLTTNDVRRLVKTFASLAAETVFFIDQSEQRHLIEPYAQAHLDKLRQELDDMRQEIVRASPPNRAT